MNRYLCSPTGMWLKIVIFLEKGSPLGEDVRSNAILHTTAVLQKRSNGSVYIWCSFSSLLSCALFFSIELSAMALVIFHSSMLFFAQ